MTQEVTNIIEKYLIEKKLEYKVVPSPKGPQFLVKRSPITGEEKWHHFYVSALTGMWQDKKTQRSGNFNQLRELYGDDGIVLPEQEYVPSQIEYKVLSHNTVRDFAQRLHSGEEKELMQYLIEERGLEEKTLLHFKIGVDRGKITIPIIDKDNVVANIRRRKNPKDTSDMPKYLPEAGCRSVLFNEKCLNNNPEEIILCEGELDAMHLWQRGITNVISTTLGASSFPSEWIERLSDVKRVFVVYDNDNPTTSSAGINAGLEGAKRVKELLGEDRVSIIELPREENESKIDITDFFVKHKKTKEDFMNLISKEKEKSSINEGVIKHVSEYSEQLRKKLLEGDYKGIPTGYEKFDKVIGGLRKGRVIVWSGLSSVGKTSSAICLALSLAQRSIPSIFITTEMSPIDIYRKFLLLHQKIPGNKLDKVEEGSSLMQLIDNGLRKFKGDSVTPGLPLYLMDSVGQVTMKKVMEVCKLSKEKYGMEVIFIDHLHYFATSMKNQEAELSNIMKQIKSIAMELDVPIVLLAHVGREGRSKQRRGLYIPTMVDLKGSSAIEQDADQIVFICRDSEAVDEAEKRKSIWKTAKNRDGATGHTSMDFDPNIGFFSEVSGVDYMQAVEQAESPVKRTPRLKAREIDDIFGPE